MCLGVNIGTYRVLHENEGLYEQIAYIAEAGCLGYLLENKTLGNQKYT